MHSGGYRFSSPLLETDLIVLTYFTLNCLFGNKGKRLLTGFQFSGSWTCTHKKRCCLYSTGTGETTSVRIGRSFSDGCNRCQCTKSKKNLGPWPCTRMMCSGCRYKNWDKATGWAKPGSDVQVFHDKGDNGKGCNKICRCIRMGYYDAVDCESEACVVA